MEYLDNTRLSNISELDDTSKTLLNRHNFNFDESTGIWQKTTRNNKTLKAHINDQGRWEITNIDDNITVTEYTIAPYNNSAPSRGADSFVQAHHPLQHDWGKKHLENFGYSEDAAPAINLRDSFSDSPHRIITNRQTNRQADINTRNFLEERKLMFQDLEEVGVPEDKIIEAVQQVDSYYQKIWNSIDDLEIRNKIFGHCDTELGW
jgi:hypothetical protein